MLSVKTCVWVMLKAERIYFHWDLCITSSTVLIFQWSVCYLELLRANDIAIFNL